MLKLIKEKGKLLWINTNNITALISMEKDDGKFYPTVSILPGKTIILDLAGSPFSTKAECDTALANELGDE